MPQYCLVLKSNNTCQHVGFKGLSFERSLLAVNLTFFCYVCVCAFTASKERSQAQIIQVAG
jgi:hypothetical protein